jgi:hypothetical protein
MMENIKLFEEANVPHGITNRNGFPGEYHYTALTDSNNPQVWRALKKTESEEGNELSIIWDN